LICDRYDELWNDVLQIVFVYTEVLSYSQWVVGRSRVECEKRARECGNEIVGSPLNDAKVQEWRSQLRYELI